MSTSQLLDYLNEADASERAGDLENAAAVMERALDVAPQPDEIRMYLAKLLRRTGRADEAYAHYRHLLARGAADLDLQVNLVDMLRTRSDRAADPELETEILQGLEFANVDVNMLAGVAAARLNHKYPAGTPDPEACARDGFLIRTLSRIFFTDAELEPKLKALRRALLTDFLAAGALGAGRADLIAALALQGANCEYVHDRDAREQRMLETLLQLQDALIAGGGAGGLLGTVLVAAMYMPVCDMPVAPHLRAMPLEDWPDGVRPLIKATLLDRFVERDLAAAVPGLRPIRDEVSRRVQAQYEENPYPRWLSLTYRPPVDFHADLRSRLPETDLPERPGRAPLEILVAGCGTGRQPISIARAYRNVSVTALDLSGASLAYGMRKAAEMDVGNIDFRQGDILDLPELDRRFDVVYSSGVLHHMADPVAGWKVLCGILEPGGLMNIALYSERARAVIVRAREIIAAEGIGDDAMSIRTFRRDVLAGRHWDELAPLTRIPDFYSLSGCRDLVFHVQEHRFDLPRIGEIGRELGLTILGFNLLRPAVRSAYGRCFPGDPGMTDLANWDRLEARNPGMFLDMYNLWFRSAG